MKRRIARRDAQWLGLVFTLVLGLLAGDRPAFAADAMGLRATTTEPRAYGYIVGDVVSRTVTLEIPEGLALDSKSLPSVTRAGRGLELQRLHWDHEPVAGPGRYALQLDYQIFLAPKEVRTLEMPALTLRFAGQPRAQDLRVDAWPVTVAPLVPVDVSPRRGLGELRPDRPAPLLETAAMSWRLVGYAVIAAVLLGYLGVVYLGLPWWSSRHRPFGTAWATVRRLGPASAPAEWQAGIRQVHEALNHTAGQVLFEQGVAGFVAARPRYAGMREDIAEFFRRSRAAFFAGNAHAAPDEVRWLVAFCRRCRDAERGSA